MPALGEIFNPFRVFWGSFIPNGVLRCQKLTPSAKLIYGRLLQYAGDNGQAYPSYSTLGNEVGLQRRQTMRSVRELEVFGLIRAVPRQKDDGSLGSNSFVFLWHHIFEGDNARNDTRGSVANDTRGSVINDTRVVSPMTPKENHLKQKLENKTTRRSGFFPSDLEDTVAGMVAGTPFASLKVEDLHGLLSDYGEEKTLYALDVVSRGQGPRNKNYAGYIYEAIQQGIREPAGFTPYSRRKAAAVEKAATRNRETAAAQEQAERERREQLARQAAWLDLPPQVREEFEARYPIPKNIDSLHTREWFHPDKWAEMTA